MYAINVSKQAPDGHYRHFFATDKRSVDSESDLQRVLPALRKAFPEPEFRIDVTQWKRVGEILDAAAQDAILAPKVGVTIRSKIEGANLNWHCDGEAEKVRVELVELMKGYSAIRNRWGFSGFTLPELLTWMEAHTHLYVANRRGDWS